jgi:hypothetical protein
MKLSMAINGVAESDFKINVLSTSFNFSERFPSCFKAHHIRLGSCEVLCALRVTYIFVGLLSSTSCSKRCLCGVIDAVDVLIFTSLTITDRQVVIPVTVGAKWLVSDECAGVKKLWFLQSFA